VIGRQETTLKFNNFWDASRFSVPDVFVSYRFSEIGRKMKGKKMGLKIFLTCHLLANKDVK